MTDFDKLMERYDNLVRENAYLQAEVKTFQQKVDSQKMEITQLRDQVYCLQDKVADLKAQTCDSEEDSFLREARKVIALMGTSANKIEMIKEVRYRMGRGLKESKDAVEQVLQEYGK